MGPETRDEPPAKPPAPRRLHLRHPGTCVACGVPMAVGDEALWDPAARAVRCVECPTGATETPIDPGVAGGSAQREYEHRRAGREARTKSRYGRRFGGVILALSDERRSCDCRDFVVGVERAVPGHLDRGPIVSRFGGQAGRITRNPRPAAAVARRSS